jgi:Flp pilus assembly protein TadD
MRLYKEKQYADAAAKFTEASKMQPTSALFANNAGFAYYRLGNFDAAAQWYRQSIALDPKRAVAYENLGDAYLNLHKNAEAKAAFEQFLALTPNSKSAPDVQEKLKNLP